MPNTKIGPKASADFTQDDVERAKAGHAHVLIAIGFLGSQRCYVDLPLAEARERFRREFHGEDEIADPDDYSTTAVGFDDCFTVYDIED